MTRTTLEYRQAAGAGQEAAVLDGRPRPAVMSDWSHEETDDPIHADWRNFYKAEKWSKDVQRVVELLFAGSLEGAGHMPFESNGIHTVLARRRHPCVGG